MYIIDKIQNCDCTVFNSLQLFSLYKPSLYDAEILSNNDMNREIFVINICKYLLCK